MKTQNKGAHMEIKMFTQLSNSEIEQIATYHFNWWSQFNHNMLLSEKIAEFKDKYAKYSNKIPCGFVGFIDGKLAGFCRLRDDMLDGRYDEFSPWVSGLLVLPEFRGQGVGTNLIEYAKSLLKKFGYKSAHLWTDQAPDFYIKLGLKYVKQIEIENGKPADLFELDLT